MIYVPIVTCIMLIQLFAFSLKAGMAREKSDIKAPATTGDETYARRNRIHLNTLELIVMAIPSMWIFATYVHTLAAAGLGFVYVIGRIIYSRAYMANPSKRGIGFMISIIPVLIMLIGSFIALIIKLFQSGQI